MPQWLKAAGYLVIAPALFDRIAPDVTLVYDGDGAAEYHSLPMQSASCKSCDYLSGLK